MNQQLTVEGSDALLWPFLRADDPLIAEELLTDLIQNHADPIIAKILQSKLRVSFSSLHGSPENQDALEIASDLRATLIAELHAVQQHPTQKSIKSFPDYVAIKTYSACADYFREKNPERWRLKNLLRYQLKQNLRFALWRGANNRWYAGLSQWEDTIGDGSALPPTNLIIESLAAKSPNDIEPGQLLDAIFERVSYPVEFERIVTLAAEVWGIRDPPLESLDDAERTPETRSVNSPPGVDTLFEQRVYLEALWSEVVQLPVLQRAALLLNLRDAQGGSAVFFIPHMGLASQQQIAQLLELPSEQFAALWNELPLDDSRIAGMFRLTRQQVINLRKTARERLARRMNKAEAKPARFPAPPADSKKAY